MSKMPSNRWLYSPEGKNFMMAVSALVGEPQTYGEPQTHGAAVASVESEDASVPTPAVWKGLAIVPAGVAASADSVWNTVVSDFRSGLFGVLGISNVATLDPTDQFGTRLAEVYRQRFDDGFAGLDADVVAHQARILGQLTANMLRLERGEFGSYPHQDPSVGLALKHFEWARDVVGFWVQARTRWDTGLPPHGQVIFPAGAATEFDNGCGLC